MLIYLQEAIAIVLEVGPSMGQAAAGDCTALQTSLEAIDMILQRKVSWYRHVIKPRTACLTEIGKLQN